MNIVVRNTIKVFLLTSAAIALIGAKCGESDQGPSGPGVVKATELRLTNVSGWSDDPSAYMELAGIEWRGPMNGGANAYIDEGLVDGIRQALTKDTMMFTVNVMDFATAEKATAMFGVKKSQNPNPGSIGNYSQDVVFYRENSGGITMFAHFSKFYFEGTLTNYSEDLAKAKSDANTFLMTYEEKF